MCVPALDCSSLSLSFLLFSECLKQDLKVEKRKEEEQQMVAGEMYVCTLERPL
jgi:hypothetical protein